MLSLQHLSRGVMAVGVTMFLWTWTVQAEVKTLSPKEVIKRYQKAAGGESALKKIRETSLSGQVVSSEGVTGTFTLDLQHPGKLRLERKFEADNRLEIAGGTSVWEQSTRAGAVTLLDETARERKAANLLLTDRRLDFKAQGLAARSLPAVQIGGNHCAVVEFVSRQRGAVRMYFSQATWLPVRLESGSGDRLRCLDFFDFQTVDGVSEPMRLELTEGTEGKQTLKVATVRHNPGLLADRFIPPAGMENLDIAALFSKIEANQRKVDERVTNYTYILTETQRELDKNGQVKETKVKVYEVYPLPGGERVLKLTSENGKPLSRDAAEKEQKRVQKFIEENQKRQEKQKNKKTDDADNEKKHEIGIKDFLRACEFSHPRRENLRGREVTVFDFNPRKNFKPSNSEEKIINKLAGTVWVDALDNTVSRLEGRFEDSFKVAGGLIASLGKGTAFTFEQTRTEEGVWLPFRADFNAGIKVFLIAGLNISVENRYSDYKRFNVSTKIDLDESAR
ncbi:MAG: hypothetical protein K1Y36_03810 [Blastocatellia bacterium]|nr:hypothetical protein [Blastocatellia bacterium]